MTARGTTAALAVALALGLTPALAQQKPGDPKPPVDRGVTARSVDDLVKALAGTDEVEREVALHELPNRGDAAVDPLVRCLASPGSPQGRLAAAKILRKLKAQSAAATLLAVYKDAKAAFELRGECALALGEAGATSAIPDLVEGLADNMFKISETARAALVAMGQPVVDPILEAYRREMQAKDGRDGIIFRSLLILGTVGGEKARLALCEAIKVQKGPRAVAVRHHAALALGLAQDKLAIEPLIEAYEVEKEFRVAQTIGLSLEWLTDEHSIPPQAYRWKAWWAANKDRVLGTKDREHENIFLPKKGLQKDDPIEEPKAAGPTDGSKPK